VLLLNFGQINDGYDENTKIIIIIMIMIIIIIIIIINVKINMSVI